MRIPVLFLMMTHSLAAAAATPLVDVLNGEVEDGGFGHAMAVHGDELVIANDFINNGTVLKGRVYRRINGQWQWQQDLDLPGAFSTDLAGHQRIVMDGDFGTGNKYRKFPSCLRESRFQDRH